MKFLVLISLVFLNLSACTSISTETTSRALFEKVEGLVPGRQKMSEVRELLGKPAEEINLSEVSELNNNGFVWQYFDKGYPRASLYFLEETLQSVAWNVRDGDPEQNPKITKKKYLADWKIELLPSSTTHTFPEICRLVDHKLGIAIDARASVRQVTTITRWQPDKGPSSISALSKEEAMLCDFLEL